MTDPQPSPTRFCVAPSSPLEEKSRPLPPKTAPREEEDEEEEFITQSQSLLRIVHARGEMPNEMGPMPALLG